MTTKNIYLQADDLLGTLESDDVIELFDIDIWEIGSRMISECSKEQLKDLIAEMKTVAKKYNKHK